MKRAAAILLLVCMITVFCLPVLAAGESRTYETVKSTIDVPVGEKKDVRFTAEGKGKIVLKSETASLGVMSDSGMFADERAHDGIQSFGKELYSNERRIEKYYAYSGDKLIAEYTVNYYNRLTAEDFAVKDMINENVAAIEKSFEGKNKTELFDAVYEYVSANDAIVSVGRNENSITYTTQAGITSVFTRFEDGYKGAGEGIADITTIDSSLNSSTTLSYTNPDIAVFRPFRHSISENGAGFAIDTYLDAVKSVKAITGGHVFLYDDEEANPYNLADIMDKVGFLYIDSHGVAVTIDGQLRSTIILENTNNDGISDADWQAARVLDIWNEGLVAVTGDYIKVNYEAQNRKLENTIIHLGICEGMKNDAIYKPFYEMGASYIEGYTETVSTWYDANCVLTISKMISKTKSGANRSYNFTEAIEQAKKEYGDVDPGGWGAVIETYGNENMTCIVPETGIDNAVLSDFDATVNNYFVAPLTVTKDGNSAYAYKQVWKSSDDSILKVTENRTVIGVKEGKATLTCTLTGGGNVIEKSCTVNVKYIKADSVKLLLKQTSFGVGSVAVVRSVIYPRTTSEKGKTIYSTNPGSVNCSGGLLYTYRPGYTQIAVVTEKGLTDSKKVIVSNKAACVQCTPFVGGTFALFATDNSSYSVIMNNKKSGSYIKYDNVTSNFGYITSSVKDASLWVLEGADNAFYIKNADSGKYLSLTSSGIDLTDNAVSKFSADGNKLQVINTEDTNNYIRFKADKGFSFTTKAQGSKIYFMERMSYSDSEKFATVKFDLGDNTFVEQRVKKGASAVAADPLPKQGKIFKGFDIPMCDIKEDITAKAIWKSGTLDDDKVLITFMHTDGSVIEEKEYKKNAKITAPSVPDEKDGLPFAYWSEDISKATHNMTVFAIYAQLFVSGDVNNDGKVNTSDAVSILKYSAGMTTLDNTQIMAANVNHDDKVNTSDAVIILKYAAGMIAEF